MKNRFKTIPVFVLSLAWIHTSAQEAETTVQKIKSFFTDNTEYKAKVQLSLGGASPLGIPAQIREIESFTPKSVVGFELNGTKWLNDKQEFGIRAGIKYEGRGMKTQARVKNYYTQIADDTGAQTTGYFTGHVITEMNNNYFTVPLSFVWNATNDWNFYGGFYFSLLTKKSFSGYIYDGMFREGTPIGEPTPFEGTAHGLYDFSDDLKPFQWGNQLGAEYKLKNKMSISFDVTMANQQVFKSDFESISFKMYNIFGNLGVSYKF